MTRTAAELATTIADFAARGGLELPRTDEQVRAERHSFVATTWRARWPEALALPSMLADVPLPATEPAEPTDAEDTEDGEVAQEGRDEQRAVVRLEITRDEVLARGRAIETADDALELYLLMCGWAGEYQDVPASRLARPLKDDGTAHALLRAAKLVRKGRAVHAYDSMWRGENRIKRVGPSLFTAWLYFASYDGWDAAHGPAPLTLDHRAARVLGWNGARVSAAAYGKYLALAAETATVLEQQVGREVTPHAVEDALFAVGRESRV